MVIRDPKPAVPEDGFIGAADTGSVHHGAQPIFAPVNARIFSGALLNALDETRGLIDAHGAAGIVSVSLEIEHEQNAARLNGGATPVRRDNAEEMFRLANRIGGVAEMIGAPE